MTSYSETGAGRSRPRQYRTGLAVRVQGTPLLARSLQTVRIERGPLVAPPGQAVRGEGGALRGGRGAEPLWGEACSAGAWSPPRPSFLGGGFSPRERRTALLRKNSFSTHFKKKPPPPPAPHRH